MNGASKILTVSYGTFSCTLEGFDEPFNTMKAIAEYFRDLASEDRYFGAEPPTPDAAMLHRIAEREIQRRVEARIEDNGVVLRAGDQMPVVKIAPQSVPTEGVEPMVRVVATDMGDEGESVADRLARARADRVAAERDTLDAATPAAANDDVLPDYAPAAGVLIEIAVVDEITVLDDLPAEFEAALDDLAVSSHVQDTTQDLSEPEVAAVFVAAQVDDLPETAAEDTVSDDVIAEADVEDQGFDIADLDLDAAEPDASELADLAAFDGDDDTDDRLLASLGAMIDPEEDDLTAMETGADAVEFNMADLADAEDTAVDVAPASDLPPADDLTFADDIASPETDDLVLAVAEPAPVDVETPAGERLQRARARVIKIRRHDAGMDAAPQVTVMAAPLPVATPVSMLSDEAEAELQRELADLEADAAPVAAAIAADRMHGLDEDVAVDRLIAQTNSAMEGPENKRRLSAIAHLKAAVAATVAERRVNPAGPVADDRSDAYRDDLNRVVRPRRPGAPMDRPAPLVLVSEQRIDRKPAPQPELAPAHSLGGTPIRPRRVRAGGLAVQTVAEAIAAPVQISAYQTDPDAVAARAVNKIGAARIGIVDQLDAEFDDEDIGNIFATGKDEGFNEFAERMGAQTMPDLLEAAGAYCALVLERPHFSRPLLLAQLSRLPEADSFTREDSLRGFGTLLRNGRIVKIKRGQFTLPEGSRALAEAKRFAG